MNAQTARKRWLQELVDKRYNGVARDFAEAVDINETSIYLALSGSRKISDKTIVRVANKLKAEPPKEVHEYAIESKTPSAVSEPTGKSEADELRELLKAQVRLTNLALDEIERQGERLDELTALVKRLLPQS